MNVWVALLNLENMYGTEKALMKVFERAIQYNEPLKVFQQLADIYVASEKYKVSPRHSTVIKRKARALSLFTQCGQTICLFRERICLNSISGFLLVQVSDWDLASVYCRQPAYSLPGSLSIWTLFLAVGFST